MNKNTKLYLIISSLIATIIGLLTFIFFPDKSLLSSKSLKDGFKLIKNPDATQQLPKTTETDQTLSDLENDILKNNK